MEQTKPNQAHRVCGNIVNDIQLFLSDEVAPLFSKMPQRMRQGSQLNSLCHRFKFSSWDTDPQTYTERVVWFAQYLTDWVKQHIKKSGMSSYVRAIDINASVYDGKANPTKVYSEPKVDACLYPNSLPTTLDPPDIKIWNGPKVDPANDAIYIFVRVYSEPMPKRRCDLTTHVNVEKSE